MKQFLQIDAYRVLGISPQANEEEIRLTYHQKIKDGDESEELRLAYDLIKDRVAREKYLWNSVHSYFEPLMKDSFSSSFDVESVISEIAFLSDWELGVSHEL